LTASLLPPPLTVSTSTPSQPTRPTAPYRPGFQPKGVYRPLTEEFISARRNHRDVGRVERTKLERRFEKLIALHFSEARDIDPNNDKVEKEKGNVRSGAADRRRTSSFFDLDLSDLRNMDAGELWKGVLQSQVVQGGKADIRGAFWVFLFQMLVRYVSFSLFLM
jgi:rabenosyn-5